MVDGEAEALDILLALIGNMLLPCDSWLQTFLVSPRS